MRRACSLALACAAMVALFVVHAGAASTAPQLSTPLACWNWNPVGAQTFPIYGHGFPSYVPIIVGIKGDHYAEAETGTDTAGNLFARVPASTRWTDVPRIVTVEALEPSKAQPPPPPRLLATMAVPAVERTGEIVWPYLFPRTFPVSLRVRVKWGGYPGQALYAHFFYEPTLWGRPHPVRTLRLGTLTGPCGGLKARSACSTARARAPERGW